MKKLKLILKILLGLAATLAVVVYFVFQMPQFGGAMTGARLDRVQHSPEYSMGRFENKPPQIKGMQLLKTIGLYNQGQVREPSFEIPVMSLDSQTFLRTPDLGLSTIWFGHSTVLVEIGGVRILTDPILSQFASPFEIGPQRFHPPPIDLRDLSGVDVVVISHDHYDHLDMATVQQLAAKGTHFYVPLGIGAHLEKWQIKPDQIHEMEWWQTAEFRGIKIHCTPARHYSGRKRQNNPTLWASWFVQSEKNSFYFSGDTGYAEHFTEIKNKLGSPDMTLMKVGAYGEVESWLDIHMSPESAVQAQLDLGSSTLLPIHWATFNLSYHAWDEPVLRTLAAATDKNIKVITPRIGEKFEFGKPFLNVEWYKGIQ